MINRILLAGLLAGLAIFLFTGIFWNALPFHYMGINTLPNGEKIIAQINEVVPESGLYVYPNIGSGEESAMEIIRGGPHIPQMIFNKEGREPMTISMVLLGLIFNIICASLTAFMLSIIKSEKMIKYGQRVLFISLFGVFIAVFTDFFYWNWWSYPVDFTIVNTSKNILTWVIAGLIIAWRIDPKEFS